MKVSLRKCVHCRWVTPFYVPLLHNKIVRISVHLTVLGRTRSRSGWCMEIFEFEILRILYPKLNIDLKEWNAVSNNRLILDKLTYFLMNFSEIILSPVCSVSLYSFHYSGYSKRLSWVDKTSNIFITYLVDWDFNKKLTGLRKEEFQNRSFMCISVSFCSE